jgi:acetate kinase
MKHKELTNHIEGSFLKRQFLEAFLVQSAYIESLLKLYADYIFFNATDGKSYDDKVLNVLRGNVERYNLNDLISFFYKADLISKDQRKLLDSYRARRNKVLHDLIKEIRNDAFEKELEDICKTGTAIIEDSKFKKIAEILETVVEPTIEKAKTKITMDTPLQLPNEVALKKS